MNQIEEIDKSLVAIFEIEGFSNENPETQAILVKSFIEYLNNRLNDLQDFKPDTFSTGDGAIVSVGRNCKLDKQTTKLFLDFVIDFALNVLKKGLIIRTAVNYSEKDRVLIIEGLKGIQGKYIQIGGTIGAATRIINFCEPRELIINKSLHDYLRKVTLEKDYPFFENEPLITKHNVELKTFTYDPPESEKGIFYSPHSPSHHYKKYNYFPLVKSSILKYFMDHGLDFELDDVISKTFDSMRALNDTKSFVSWHNVLEVLIQLNYDPSDSVYVISRNDRASGFWTQPRKNTYINYLKINADKYDGQINQTRVMVYNESLSKGLMPKDDIFFDLKKLHKSNTFFSIPASSLIKYEKLSELIFGFTLSKKHKYAIIPIPAPEAMGTNTPKLDNIGKTLKMYENYDVTHGPMKAIITANNKYVEKLIEEMEKLLKDQQIYKIK